MVGSGLSGSELRALRDLTQCRLRAPARYESFSASGRRACENNSRISIRGAKLPGSNGRCPLPQRPSGPPQLCQCDRRSYRPRTLPNLTRAIRLTNRELAVIKVSQKRYVPGSIVINGCCQPAHRGNAFSEPSGDSALLAARRPSYIVRINRRVSHRRTCSSPVDFVSSYVRQRLNLVIWSR